MTGHVTIDITQAVNNQDYQNQSYDTDCGCDGGDKKVAAGKKATTTPLRSYGVFAFGIALSDCLGERRQWFIGFGSKRIANLLAALESMGSRSITRRRRVPFGCFFLRTVIAIIYTHNKQPPSPWCDRFTSLPWVT